MRPLLPILFILDSETAFVFEAFRKNNHFVLNEASWEQTDKGNLTYKAIVILAELGWQGKSLHEDFGFSVGLELRRKYKCLLPIIITSTIFQSHFELRAGYELQYNLLYARGTYFLPLKEASKQLSEVLAIVESVSLPLLTDMNEMLFNLRGVLADTLGHRLRAGIERSVFLTLMQEMKALLNKQQVDVIHWNEHQNALEMALSNHEKFNALKSGLLQVINTTFLSAQSETSLAFTECRHTLLFVEDDELFAAEVQCQLCNYFKEIIWVNDAAEAIKLIQNDKGNHIAGLLCDWRLYKGNTKKYWQQQGYEVLAYAANNSMMALFSITSLSDTNVLNIRNMLGFEMHLFKKEHFIGQNATMQWQVMADVILQKCDTVVQQISSEPTGANWLKLRNEYILKRNSGWQTFETEIDSEANRIFLFYRDAIEKADARNVYSINEMGLVLKSNLKNILIIRRVFMGIYFFLSQRNLLLQEIHPTSLLGNGKKVDTDLRHHGIDAYSILRKDWWDDIEAGKESALLQEEWEKFDQRIKNFRNALCIDISEIPRKGTLPEEKSWMIHNHIDFSFLFSYWEDDF